MRRLLETIERVLPDGGDWCSLDKATTLASMIVALRPRVVVEIGVWMGGSAVPMALALQYIDNLDMDDLGDRVLVAIDPWAKEASASGETEKNAAWWRSVDHAAALATFERRLEMLALRSYVRIERAKSDDVTPPNPIDMLHVDGNHREQAVRDVERFAPKIRVGGIMILDDLEWEGGHVQGAASLAKGLGFDPLYRLDKGLVMLRRYPRVDFYQENYQENDT